MWFNPLVKWLLRSPLHFFLSKNTMLMTYTGRKTGRQYTTPMNYLQVGDAYYTISSRDRTWWRNLRGGAAVTLLLQGHDVPAQAEAVEDPARLANLLQTYFAQAPQLARYLDVQLNAAGQPEPGDLARLADERVLVISTLK
ncbi:MAG: nitroreductase/quinone reductase family protein [Anaerolineales bacterium]|jgi:deazaflavin-dependent oxidoreductase (nitroreductase family)